METEGLKELSREKSLKCNWKTERCLVPDISTPSNRIDSHSKYGVIRLSHNHNKGGEGASGFILPVQIPLKKED